MKGKDKAPVEMRNSRLVQRLEKPFVTGRFAGEDNPFSFGGGYKNGGLSAEAMALLRPILAFDYMGAAEYEFGEVPKGFGKMVEHGKNLIDGRMYIGSKTIYYLCHEKHEEEVKARIVRWSTGDDAEIKRGTHLKRVLTQKDDEKYPSKVCGWIELENGFMFFTDMDMLQGMKRLLGVS